MISAWAHDTFASLRYPQYRTLWIGTSLAFLAFMMSWVVQSVVAFDLTGKNESVGIVGLGMGISQLLISPFGGVLADRVSKRRLLLIGQSSIAFSFAVVGVLILTDRITIPLLVASTFVMGFIFAFIAPARQAWIGELLPTEAMANGIALQQVAMTGTRIIGPFIAGAFVAFSFVGSGGTYLFMAGLLILVVVTLAKLPPTQSTAKRGSTVWGDMKLGLTHVAERPQLQLLVVSFIAVVIAGYSWQVLLPGLLENELGHSSKQLAWLMGMSAFSGLVVTLILASRAGSPHAWKIMFLGAAALGVSLILLGVTPNYVTALGIMLLLGAGTGAFQMLNNSLVMQVADAAYFGRVMALTMLAWGFNGLMGLPFGIMADRVGERQTLLLMGVLVLGVTLLAVLWHLSVQRKLHAPGLGVAPRLAGGK